MFLFRVLWWLLLLPFRLVLFVVGLALWVLVLPLRLVFCVLGLFGLGRLLQLGIIVSLGYFFYRLVNDPAPGDGSAPRAG
jgi:hypothetical protein